jgi:magnesium transporter
MQAYVLVEGKIQETSSLEEIRAARKKGHKMWLDLDHQKEGIDRLLADDFGIHPLVLEDIWADRSIPKIDPFDSYLYIVAHGVTPTSAPAKVDLWVLDLVVSETFVVTQHRNPASRAAIRNISDRLPQLLGRGTPWLAHAILDAVVDVFLPLVDRIGARIDLLEEEIFRKAGKPEGALLGESIFAIKRSIQRMSRITTHQRAILEKLAGGEFASVPRDAVPYYRDVAEHFIRVAERTDEYRDDAANAMDAFLTMQSNRLNETMKALTMMSTCMLPVTFIASLYGMNFKHMPELQWEYGYPFALLLMALVAALVFSVFRRKRWV